MAILDVLSFDFENLNNFNGERVSVGQVVSVYAAVYISTIIELQLLICTSITIIIVC